MDFARGGGFARALLALAWCLAAAAGFAQNYELRAEMEPPEASPGMTVVYALTVTFDGTAPPAPQLPKFDPSWGLSEPKFAGTQTSAQITSDPGGQRVSQSVSYRYSFMASREGTFVIPPSGFAVSGKQFRSNPVTLRVTKTQQVASLPAELQGRVVPPQVPGNPQLQNALAGKVFVLPVVETPTPYAGQQVLLTYYLCLDQQGLVAAGLQAGSLFAESPKVPELSQFLKEVVYQLPKQMSFREQTIGGKRFAVAALYQVAITPTKTGKLVAEPFSVDLFMPQRGGTQRRDPFDSFFDDPFFGSPLMGSNRVQIRAMSPAVDFDVKPLPADGKPAGFSGAVGDFSIAATLDKTTAIANEDLVKLQVKVEGRGDAASLPNPAVPKIDGIRVLEDPKTGVTRRTENDQIVSAKTFDYILRATRPGHIEIPPMELTTFNPRTGQYGVIRTKPLALEAGASTRNSEALVAADTAVSSGGEEAGPAPGTKALSDDIRYIRDGAMTVAAPGTLTGDSGLFWVLVCAPPVAWAAAWAAGRRRRSIASNRAAFRAAGAGAAARRRLRRAAKARASSDASAFFGELATALRGYFGDKFRLDPAQLTMEQIESEIERRGAGRDAVTSARELLDGCDAARYAPTAPSAEEVDSAYTRAAALIDELEKLK